MWNSHYVFSIFRRGYVCAFYESPAESTDRIEPRTFCDLIDACLRFRFKQAFALLNPEPVYIIREGNSLHLVEQLGEISPADRKFPL